MTEPDLEPPVIRQPTADPQGGPPPGPVQITKAELSRLNPEQILEAKAAGRLDNLLGIRRAHY